MFQERRIAREGLHAFKDRFRSSVATVSRLTAAANHTVVSMKLIGRSGTSFRMTTCYRCGGAPCSRPRAFADRSSATFANSSA